MEDEHHRRATLVPRWRRAIAKHPLGGYPYDETRYDPYGETRLVTGSMFTDKLFTGQREITGLGIYHFGAHFYSPKLGRFLSADTIVPNAFNTQAFNRYSYVYNNPLRYVDPSGNIPIDCYGTSYCGSTNSQLLPAPYVPPSSGGGGSTGGRGGRRGESDEPTTPTVVRPTVVILACGQGAGANCDNTLDYGGELPLAPYYQLSESPSVYGVDGYQDPSKLNMANEIYDQISNDSGSYILIGHSAGGSALVLAVSMLQADGHGSQISALVLLDPAMDPSYPSREGLVNLQTTADLIVPNGITVFLGDSPQDGNDAISGAIEFSTGSDVNHFQLATNYFIYDLIVNDPHWSP